MFVDFEKKSRTQQYTLIIHCIFQIIQLLTCLLTPPSLTPYSDNPISLSMV